MTVATSFESPPFCDPAARGVTEAPASRRLGRGPGVSGPQGRDIGESERSIRSAVFVEGFCSFFVDLVLGALVTGASNLIAMASFFY